MTAFTLRPPTPADLPALVALDDASEVERSLEPSGEIAEWEEQWSSPGYDAGRFVTVAERDGEVVGYTAMHPREGFASAGGYVLPAHRGLGIGTAMMRWLVETAREVASELHVWSAVEIPASVELIEGWGGFKHDRSFFRMTHASPSTVPEPLWPEGIEVRTHEDHSLAVDAFAEGYDGSFVDHWNFHPTDKTRLAHRARTAELDLWFFAYDGDRLAGFCVTERYGPARDRGDLGPIGTLRPYRGRGIARALVRHGTRAVAGKGARDVTLGVDTQHGAGAVRLYESEGYARTGEGRVYRMPL